MALPEGWQNADMEKLMQLFLDEEVDEFGFYVEKMRDEGPNQSFSQEAMQKIHDQVWAWIGARLMARWNKTKRGPQKMLIDVRITFDEEAEAEREK
jgi:hypothetical protein